MEKLRLDENHVPQVDGWMDGWMDASLQMDRKLE
jgi:hypothetical protein